MIAEPYICTEGPNAGMINWYDAEDESANALAGCHQHPNAMDGRSWQPYADFEREKLLAMQLGSIRTLQYLNDNKVESAYMIGMRRVYESSTLIGYFWDEYMEDSESARLLKRAEFLKAVCEKEVVEWLPKPDAEECEHPKNKQITNLWNGHVGCMKCHKEDISKPSPSPEEKPRLIPCAYCKGLIDLDKGHVCAQTPTPSGDTKDDRCALGLRGAFDCACKKCKEPTWIDKDKWEEELNSREECCPECIAIGPVNCSEHCVDMYSKCQECLLQPIKELMHWLTGEEWEKLFDFTKEELKAKERMDEEIKKAMKNRRKPCGCKIVNQVLARPSCEIHGVKATDSKKKKR